VCRGTVRGVRRHPAEHVHQSRTQANRRRAALIRVVPTGQRLIKGPLFPSSPRSNSSYHHVPTIGAAVEKYLGDAEARHLAAETVRKRRELLTGKLLPFCDSRGYQILPHLDVDVLRTFRASWPYAPLSARKRLEYLRSFFRFCQDSGWVDRNPAMAMRSSKVEQNPTLPFTEDEVERILTAAQALTAFGRYGPKIEAMVLLLRYSGLRMQDAACLERARLVDDKLFLYQQKTGTPVYCPLPPLVVERLAAVPNANAQFFFYDGKSQRQSMVKS
jgi:integrase/recombinase XerD